MSPLRRELDYYIERLDELTATNLRLDASAAELRRRLGREHQRVELVSELHAAVEAFRDLPSLYATLLELLQRRLGMDRALLLVPAGPQQLRAAHAVGYAAPGPTQAPLELAAELETRHASALVTRTQPASGSLRRLGEALALPYFAAVPLVVDGTLLGVLVAGRVQEATNLVPSLDAEDLAALQWVARVVGSSIRLLRIATLEEEARWKARLRDLERTHLAQDLHDSVGSALTLLGLYGDLLEASLDDPARLRSLAESLREAGRYGAGELRGVLLAMSSDATSLHGLAEALRRVANHASRASGASVELDVESGDEHVLEGSHRLALMRVFQEALSNALRHGRARAVTAALGADDATTWLEVRDDGQGFDPQGEAVREGALGLTGMQRRATDLGGVLELVSAPGRGTLIRLRIPRSSPHRVSP